MYTERIDRMLAEGLLTETQADALRRSLAPLGRNSDRPPRRASRLALVVALTGLAAVLLALVIAALYAPGVESGAEVCEEIRRVSPETKELPTTVGESVLATDAD